MRGLDWSDERYVRLYRTDTADWLALSWHARGLYALLRRISDRAGLIRIGRTGRRGIAALVHASHDAPAVLTALDELERDGWVEFAETGSTGDPCLILPEFLESEEARTSDAARQRAKRERERDKARASIVQYPTQGRHGGESHAVTEERHGGASRRSVTPIVTQGRHGGESHAVTEERHSVPSVPSQDPDLTHDVVVAIPSIARVIPSGDDGKRDGRDSQPDPTPPPSTARSVPAPPRIGPPPTQGMPDVAFSTVAPTETSALTMPPVKAKLAPSPPMPPFGERPRKPRYELQTVPGFPGVAINDPETGLDLVLDLAELSPAEVEAKRELGLAAMRSAGKLPGAVSAHRSPDLKPDSLVASPNATTEPAPASPRPPSTPTPLPGMLDGDLEDVMRRALEMAPMPIRLLAQHSARRYSSLLMGGQLRSTDLAPTFSAAAAKLDRRFEMLNAESSEAELEELHRFVAGYLARAPMMRRSASAAPQIAEPTEAGKLFLRFFQKSYKAKTGRDYCCSEDDGAHAEAIAQELERRLSGTKPDELAQLRKRKAARLVSAWLSDPFAGKCGHALKQLARLFRDEPNRFELVEQPVMGAGGVPPDLEPARAVVPLSPEEAAALRAQLAQIGTGPTTLEAKNTRTT